MPQDIKTIARNDAAPQEPNIEEAELLLTPKIVAKRLQISIDMVYKLVREGDLEAIHIGRLLRIKPESYEKLLDRLATKAR